MKKYTLGCCIPGASFMPEGEAGIKRSPLAILTDGCEKIIGAGFDYAEAGVGMVMNMTDAEFEEAVRLRLPIRAANSFIPFEYKIVADGACDEGSPLYVYVNEALRRMAALGGEVVVFGSGGARRIPEGMTVERGHEYIVEFLKMCGALGERHGVTVAIEPLRASECNAVNLVGTGLTLAERANSPRVGYLADAFHMFHGGEDADLLTRLTRLPEHIHISEPPDRTCPGLHGGEYLRAFADGVKRTTYAGRISVECGFSDFAREVGEAYAFTSKIFNG